jgi:hypothetical protein
MRDDKKYIADFELLRYSSAMDSTLGLLFDNTDARQFLCYTLEDEYRTRKISGETRIPAGKYAVSLRNTGGMNSMYSEKYDYHVGMLHLLHVPNFEYVYIHIGNDDDDTSGCILVGDRSTQNITQKGFIGSSTTAYRRIYKHFVKRMKYNKQVFMNIIDYDKRDV